jgi:hypothetical protein
MVLNRNSNAKVKLKCEKQIFNRISNRNLNVNKKSWLEMLRLILPPTFVLCEREGSCFHDTLLRISKIIRISKLGLRPLLALYYFEPDTSLEKLILYRWSQSAISVGCSTFIVPNRKLSSSGCSTLIRYRPNRIPNAKIQSLIQSQTETQT